MCLGERKCCTRFQKWSRSRKSKTIGMNKQIIQGNVEIQYCIFYIHIYWGGGGGGQDVLHCNVWIADPEALLHALLYQSFTAGWSLAQRKGWIHQQLDYKNKHCVNSACSKEQYCVNWHASKWIKLQISLLSARLSLILCASVTDRRGH